MTSVSRCAWAGKELMHEYHDTEWGVPVHDDGQLFEMLTLEGAQAGLSWDTVLRKRENYRQALDGFDVERIARYDESKLTSLMSDAGIVRNRLKIESLVRNARGALAIRQEFGSLDAYLWAFVDGRPIRNSWRNMSELPARTPVSTEMSKDLRARGFNFVGPTICYAFMQAVGMVNDHEVSCFRYGEVT